VYRKRESIGGMKDGKDASDFWKFLDCGNIFNPLYDCPLDKL